MKDSDRKVNPAPMKYKRIIEADKSDIVNGSVEGVMIADKIADDKTTILQFEIIFSVEIIPNEPRMNCKIGS